MSDLLAGLRLADRTLVAQEAIRLPRVEERDWLRGWALAGC